MATNKRKGPKFRAGQRVLLECVVYKNHGTGFISVDTSNDSKYVVISCVEEQQLRPLTQREAGPGRGRRKNVR